MERLHKLWWDEEVNEKFQVLRRFSHALWLISMSIRIPWLFLFPDKANLVLIYVPYVIMHTITCFLLWYIRNKGTILKATASIIFAEYYCFFLWIMGTVQNKPTALLFSMLAILYTNSFELPFIQSSKIKLLIIIKHLFMWHYLQYLHEPLDLFIADYMPHMISILILVLYNMNSYFIRMKSFRKFISQKNTEERLSLVINLFPDGILIKSYKNEILYINENLKSLLGCSASEILPLLETIQYSQGKKYSNLSNSNLLVDDINLIKNLEINQEVHLGLNCIGDKNLEWRGQKVLWDDKEAVLLTVRNANHIIQLEQAISDGKLKNVLLRTVSHELRTPINAISFLAESLLNEPKIVKNNMWKEKLDMISVSSRLLISLINDLLDYSRMLAGVFVIQKTKFLIKNIINNTIQLIKIQAVKKGIDVITRIDPELPNYAYTDPLRFSQIILNLLSNALKFTLAGSIEICFIFNSESKLKTSIIDTGIGIEKEKLNTLFEEFHTNSNTGINPNGCGLGLHISNRIVKELGGNSIEVISEIQKGSTFSFIIDILEDPKEKIYEEDLNLFPNSDEIVSFSLRNFNTLLEPKEIAQVLIVDDNEFNRFILGGLLSHNKILFNEACTGKQAIDMVIQVDKKKKPYKVVIMDGSMPELNGWEATKHIISLYNERKLEALPNIIGYTAFTSEEDLSLCLESGMKECLVKPCSADILVNTIFRYLLL